MASRRQRIKAVANLPVRRPRGPAPSDNGSSSGQQDCKDNIPGSVHDASLSGGLVDSRLPSASENVTVNAFQGKESGPGRTAETASVSSGNVSETPQGSGNGACTRPVSACEDSPQTSEIIVNKDDIKIEDLSAGDSHSSKTDKPPAIPVSSVRTLSESAPTQVALLGGNCAATVKSESPHGSASDDHEATVIPVPSESGLSSSESTPVATLDGNSSDISKPASPQGSASEKREATVISVSSESGLSSSEPTQIATLDGNSSDISKPASPQGSASENREPTVILVSSESGLSSSEPTPVATLDGNSSDISKPASPQGSDASSVVRLGRKRFKPAVSLIRAGRRPRDVAESKEHMTVDNARGGTSSRTQSGVSLSSAGKRPGAVSDLDKPTAADSGDGKMSPGVSVARPPRDIVDLDKDSTADNGDRKILPCVSGSVNLIRAGKRPRDVDESDVPTTVDNDDGKISHDPKSAVVSEPEVPQLGTPQARTTQMLADTPPLPTVGESDDDSRASCVTETPTFIKKLGDGNSQPRPSNLVLNGKGSLDVTGTPDSDQTTVHFGSESDKDTGSDNSSLCSQPPASHIGIRYEKPRKRRLEITQKLLEAKQQFYAKFGNRTPEKSRLTMLDLIFYNPTTNPMRKAQKETTVQPAPARSSPAPAAPENSTVEERLAEESVDNPEEENEESFAMPVPQVKVGADGQIILDETSLVIETTGAKKSREDLANSVAVLDQGISTYNAYSKVKKAKGRDWSQRETLMFYKALQTVGTDFLLMQTIFPKRSRTELKMKFKREEKMNLSLVEKALANPLPFDLTELEKESELLEDEENKAKEKPPKQKKERVKKAKRKSNEVSRCGALARSFDKEDTGKIRNKRVRAKARRRGKDCTQDKGNESSSEESTYSSLMNGIATAEGGGSDSGSGESEAELRKSPSTTRSGRISKPRILTDITQEDYNTNWARSDRAQISSDTVSRRDEVALPFDMRNLEPGSIVVLTTESPDNPGHQIVNVFMVGPRNETVLPIVPDSELQGEPSDEMSEQMATVDDCG